MIKTEPLNAGRTRGRDHHLEGHANANARRRRHLFRLPRARPTGRHPVGVPAPLHRGARRLGPASHRRDRRSQARHYLRQPWDRRHRRQGPTHARRDGGRRGSVHPRARSRERRSDRLLDRGRRRTRGHARESRARTPADPGRDGRARWRRPDEDAADRRKRVPQGDADSPGPTALPVFQPQSGGQARRDGVHRPSPGTHTPTATRRSHTRRASHSSRRSGRRASATRGT